MNKLSVLSLVKRNQFLPSLETLQNKILSITSFKSCLSLNFHFFIIINNWPWLYKGDRKKWKTNSMLCNNIIGMKAEWKMYFVSGLRVVWRKKIILIVPLSSNTRPVLIAWFNCAFYLPGSDYLYLKNINHWGCKIKKLSDPDPGEVTLTRRRGKSLIQRVIFMHMLLCVA